MFKKETIIYTKNITEAIEYHLKYRNYCKVDFNPNNDTYCIKIKSKKFKKIS